MRALPNVSMSKAKYVPSTICIYLINSTETIKSNSVSLAIVNIRYEEIVLDLK